MQIPFANPASDEATMRGGMLAAIEIVIARGNYILGPEVVRFEDKMAHRLGVAGAVGVASGTDALVLALTAVGVSRGDEVITVSHTAGPTVAAIRMLNAVPVFVDVSADTYCLDAAKLECCIGPRTRALIAVHLYGHPANMEQISQVASRYAIPIVEDCAQAQESAIDNRPAGTWGAVGCFSFYPTKSLGAIGDGGLVVAREPDLVNRLRVLRTYGWTSPQFANISGGRCSRLDEIQASVLSVKLAKLDDAITRRRELARRYKEAFTDLPLVLPIERASCRHVYHLYVVRCDCRDALARELGRQGISTGIHYKYPVHLQPGLAEGSRIPEPLVVTEHIAGQILSLPLFPSMTHMQQEHVIAATRTFFGKG